MEVKELSIETKQKIDEISSKLEAKYNDPDAVVIHTLYECATGLYSNYTSVINDRDFSKIEGLQFNDHAIFIKVVYAPNHSNRHKVENDLIKNILAEEFDAETTGCPIYADEIVREYANSLKPKGENTEDTVESVAIKFGGLKSKLPSNEILDKLDPYKGGAGEVYETEEEREERKRRMKARMIELEEQRMKREREEKKRKEVERKQQKIEDKRRESERKQQEELTKREYRLKKIRFWKSLEKEDKIAFEIINLDKTPNSIFKSRFGGIVNDNVDQDWWNYWIDKFNKESWTKKEALNKADLFCVGIMYYIYYDELRDAKELVVDGDLVRRIFNKVINNRFKL